MIKKNLLLIPLLTLCSCFDKGVCYENVSYSFDFDKREYTVEIEDVKKTFSVEIENVYYIYDYGYYYTKDKKEILYNEFYTKPNRLYIYKIR